MARSKKKGDSQQSDPVVDTARNVNADTVDSESSQIRYSDNSPENNGDADINATRTEDSVSGYVPEDEVGSLSEADGEQEYGIDELAAETDEEIVIHETPK